VGPSDLRHHAARAAAAPTPASRLDEAAATLEDEEVRVESYFTVEIEGEKYLLWYQPLIDIPRETEM
jgi:hypothetical protein